MASPGSFYKVLNSDTLEQKSALALSPVELNMSYPDLVASSLWKRAHSILNHLNKARRLHLKSLRKIENSR